MSALLKRRLLFVCAAWIAYFALPDPRTAVDYVLGSGVRNPQYLFADSEYQACRRVRRVIDNGKPKIYVENLSSYTFAIVLTEHETRKLISICHNLRLHPHYFKVRGVQL